MNRWKTERSLKTAILYATILLGMVADMWAEIENELSATVILAERRMSSPRDRFSGSTSSIREAAPRGIDELLATDPSFSLFRRQNAFFSNPTASGVSLDNTGASAASRSLVLRDGIPQNDPFGGWVSWTRYDPALLSSARITTSAESSVWGNMSPAGTVQLTSREIDEDKITLRASAGSQATRRGSISLDEVSNSGEFALSVHVFALTTEGFHTLHPSQRGRVDRRLDLDYEGIDLKSQWVLHKNLIWETNFSFYQENRGNGTALSRNSSRAYDVSLRATQLHEGGKLQYLGYYQRRDFSSVFSSVSADRNTEIVALNQYDVPGEGMGGAVMYVQELGPRSDLTLGMDLRFLRGETNEEAGGFRRRQAGGRQTFLGGFGKIDWNIGADTRIHTHIRFDHWSSLRGFRNETGLSSGIRIRSDSYRDRSSLEPSASISLNHLLGKQTKSWLSVGTSFRAPTINELFRPFRIRSDVTEANAGLNPERFFTLEAGLEWSHENSLKLSGSVFQHWIHDAIANVPITDAGEISRIFGRLPVGGTGAQRQNVARAQVLGIRGSVEYSPDPRLTLRLDGLWSESEFTRSRSQPRLEGESFPQVPSFRATGSLTFRPLDSWSVFLGAEYANAVFDDLMGERELPSYWTCRLGAAWQLNESLSFSLRIENLLDEEVPTGLANNGLQSVGQPRAIWIGTELVF